MTDDRPTPVVRTAAPEDAGRVCPYCRFALKPGTEVVECGGCRAPHHAECWGDNGGCAMMGCSGGPDPGDAAGEAPTQALAPPGAAVPPPPVVVPPPPAAAAPPPPPPAAGSAGAQPPPPHYPPPVGGRAARGGPALVAAVLVLALAVAGAAVALVVSSSEEDAPVASAVTDDSEGGRDVSTEMDADDDTSPPATAPDADVLPADDEATMARDIQDVLYRHHQAIVDGDYSTAWDLTSSRYQAKKVREDGYAAWQTAQESLTPHLEPSGLTVDILELDDREGVATIAVTGMGWTNPSSACSTWSGKTWAHHEDGVWRYEPGYSMTSARRARWEPRRDELLGWGC